MKNFNSGIVGGWGGGEGGGGGALRFCKQSQILERGS